ncbi:MAG: hypothetical protein COV72_03790, partial [Candidatus Omnitrophica bacterium CG11_big_fil_rev_8_21_14_0_20_42_13]
MLPVYKSEELFDKFNILNASQKEKYLSFVDYWATRVMRNKAEMGRPFNFKSGEEWIELLGAYGLRDIELNFLGFPNDKIHKNPQCLLVLENSGSPITNEYIARLARRLYKNYSEVTDEELAQILAIFDKYLGNLKVSIDREEIKVVLAGLKNDVQNLKINRGYKAKYQRKLRGELAAIELDDYSDVLLVDAALKHMGFSMFCPEEMRKIIGWQRGLFTWAASLKEFVNASKEKLKENGYKLYDEAVWSQLLEQLRLTLPQESENIIERYRLLVSSSPVHSEIELIFRLYSRLSLGERRNVEPPLLKLSFETYDLWDGNVYDAMAAFIRASNDPKDKVILAGVQAFNAPIWKKDIAHASGLQVIEGLRRTGLYVATQLRDRTYRYLKLYGYNKFLIHVAISKVAQRFHWNERKRLGKEIAKIQSFYGGKYKHIRKMEIDLSRLASKEGAIEGIVTIPLELLSAEYQARISKLLDTARRVDLSYKNFLPEEGSGSPILNISVKELNGRRKSLLNKLNKISGRKDGKLAMPTLSNAYDGYRIFVDEFIKLILAKNIPKNNSGAFKDAVSFSLLHGIYNALIHGNGLHKEKLIFIEWNISSSRLILKITDQGSDRIDFDSSNRKAVIYEGEIISGMGEALGHMESLVDNVALSEIIDEKGRKNGAVLTLVKKIRRSNSPLQSSRVISSQKELSKSHLINALIKFDGNISRVAREFKVSRTKISNYAGEEIRMIKTQVELKEKMRVILALEIYSARHGGYRMAAEYLGLSEPAFGKKLKKFNLSFAQFRSHTEEEALKSTGGNITKAAKLLGVSEKPLGKKHRKLAQKLRDETRKKKFDINIGKLGLALLKTKGNKTIAARKYFNVKEREFYNWFKKNPSAKTYIDEVILKARHKKKEEMIIRIALALAKADGERELAAHYASLHVRTVYRWLARHPHIEYEAKILFVGRLLNHISESLKNIGLNDIVNLELFFGEADLIIENTNFAISIIEKSLSNGKNGNQPSNELLEKWHSYRKLLKALMLVFNVEFNVQERTRRMLSIIKSASIDKSEKAGFYPLSTNRPRKLKDVSIYPNRSSSPAAKVIDIDLVSQYLQQICQKFSEINEKLEVKREPIKTEMIENIIDGYTLLADMLGEKSAFDTLYKTKDLNLRVLIGSDLRKQLEYNSFIVETMRVFDKNIIPIQKWYFKKRNVLSGERVAAGVYVRILSHPQLFIEGNHRTGSIIVNGILRSHDLAPFVLTLENMVDYLNLSSEIKFKSKKKYFDKWKLMSLEIKFSEFLRENIDEGYLKVISTSSPAKRPERRSGGESKWAAYDRFKFSLQDILSGLSAEQLGKVLKVSSVGELKNLLRSLKVSDVDNVGGKFLLSAMVPYKEIIEDAREEAVKPFRKVELIYGGHGRHLYCLKNAQGYIIKYPNSSSFRHIDLYWLNPLRNIAARILEGLAAPTILFDARAGEEDALAFREKGRGIREEEVVIVQREVIPWVEYLKRLARGGNILAAQNTIDRYKAMIIRMYERGAIDTDKHGILANYGIEKGGLRIYSFDFGDLSDSKDDAAVFIKELNTINTMVFEQVSAVSRTLRDYINKHYDSKGLFVDGDFVDLKDKDNFGRDLTEADNHEQFRLKFAMDKEAVRDLFLSTESWNNDESSSPLESGKNNPIFIIPADYADKDFALGLGELNKLADEKGWPEAIKAVMNNPELEHKISLLVRAQDRQDDTSGIIVDRSWAEDFKEEAVKRSVSEIKDRDIFILQMEYEFSNKFLDNFEKHLNKIYQYSKKKATQAAGMLAKVLM